MSNKPLRQNLAVVKSPLVKQAPPAYADFDRFAALGDKLVEARQKIDEVVEALQDAEVPADWQIETAERYLEQKPKLEKIMAQFRAAETFYDRDELYDRLWNKQKPEEPAQIGEKFVSDRLALLIGGFPNSAPHSPEIFSKMLFEETMARNPDAIVLEGACRVLRRTKTFVPTIAEMLKAIQEEEGRWRDRFQAAGTAGDSCSIIDYLTDLAEEVLPKAKGKQTAEAEKIAVAYRLGREARMKGDARWSPMEYRNAAARRGKTLCDAWKRGWDEQDREEKYDQTNKHR
jgi:hypothetical protein